MHAIRQKFRPKHQVLILKCYPITTKGAVDVNPNSSELSYLLYYATTRRSKVQKVGAFLEEKTTSDVSRARIGNVQVTLQILTALIEKAPRDLPLYAPYVLKTLSVILRSRDITMVESSIPTFQAFCEHHEGASLAADQEYLDQYEDIVRTYASFASTKPPSSKHPASAPVILRWRSVGLQAIKSVATSEALASLAGKQLDVIVPMSLENLWTDDEGFISLLEHKVRLEEKVDTERLLRRRTSISTDWTAETSGEGNPLALSETTADADKFAKEEIGVLAIECLKSIFVVNNRSQIHGATTATLTFIADLVEQGENVIGESIKGEGNRGWATRIFEMIARWTPVQDRYVIVVTAMDTLVRSPITEGNLQQQMVLATMVDSLLRSDINLIGLSVMDVLLGLIQHVLRNLQLGGVQPHLQQENGTGGSKTDGRSSMPSLNTEAASMPTDLRRDLLSRLQDCIAHLATHVYYADQISDMVSAILLRLKPSPVSGQNSASNLAGDLMEDPGTDAFFSFATAKVKALESINSIISVASFRKNISGGGSLGRNRIPLRVWEGSQWLLRDIDGKVRKAYIESLMTWLDHEIIRSDLKVFAEKPKASVKTHRDDMSANLSKRAVSNASNREKSTKPLRTSFLPLLHLAIYENSVQLIESEADIALLHLLLTSLVDNLGVNAVKEGLPMIFRLQEDILEAETPLAKIRMGSLCHGYFWMLSEKFDFDTSPIGRAIQNEIHRRRSKMFWVDQIRVPPIPLENLGTPGETTPQHSLPSENMESESLRAFDDRFQMVKLISLSYSESFASTQVSPPTSPGRNFSHPILSPSAPGATQTSTMPEKVKEQMMSEWTKEAVMTTIREGTKTVSLNGSRSGTQTTRHRNFLAVNGGQNDGRNSASPSPNRQQNAHYSTSSRPNSTYGLVGGLGALQKLRKDNGQSPSVPSESSRNSITRVDQLKRVLSGQPTGNTDAIPTGLAHSDASSESMVSYDFTASEVSFIPVQQSGPSMERSASLRESNDNSISKPREHKPNKDQSRPLTAQHTMAGHNRNSKIGDPKAVPPVPPIPSVLTGNNVSVHDHDNIDGSGKGIGTKQSTRNKDGENHRDSSWGEESSLIADLESLLKGINTGDLDQKGNVGKPRY